MCSRSTPFGLFSGCGLTKWDEAGAGVCISRNNFFRRTRLDMHYLCALGQHLAAHPVVQPRLLFFPNNSYYPMGDELRYVEYRYQQGRRMHQISSVHYNEYVQQVLRRATTGARIGDLVNLLAGTDDISAEEAQEFVQEMIDAQVLVSEMDPAITGDEFIFQLLAVLRKQEPPVPDEIKAMVLQLESIVQQLQAIDAAVEQPVAVYAQLADTIRLFPIPFEENKLLQTDLFSRPAGAGISRSLQQPLLDCVELLARLFPAVEKEPLQGFADRFRNRYEDRLMPLLQVLDTETGIGYTEQSGRNLSPLLEPIRFPARQEAGSYTINWNKTEDWLLRLLLDHRDAFEISIDDKLPPDLPGIPALPPSLSVLFSITANNGLLFRGASGSSAANLLGRFAHGDPAIAKLVRKITEAEQARNPDVLFAEIVHLPEDRVGNILLHPAFRRYEIPYLAQASVPEADQLPLQDLAIRVSSDRRITLWSMRLQREIIPRLSNAHNYSLSGLPVYRFLADLQTQQQVGGLNFQWGAMARQFRFLPRIRYRDCILAEATWQLGKDEWKVLAQQYAAQPSELQEFRQRWKLPELVVLADGDNELVVDFDNPHSVAAWLQTIKDRDAIMLKEFMHPAADIAGDEETSYCNQLVAVLLKTSPTYPPQTLVAQAVNPVQRTFLPGSEWLYYKIYCGSKTADELLSQLLHPLTARLLGSGHIDKWFFIRYNDPDFHLRFRLHLPDSGMVGVVMKEISGALLPAIDAQWVYKIQLDSYERETERYGGALIGAAEDFFFRDSMLKLDFLQLTAGDDREHLRWVWGMRGVDELLNLFGLVPEEKLRLMTGISQSFAAEFNAGKDLFKQLNQQYAGHRKEIAAMMYDNSSDSDKTAPLRELYNKYRPAFAAAFAPVAERAQK